MVALFTLALFTSAALLFWIQPMFAKMILPLLGGTPGVWNTSMVFYQAVLLGGYGYAHLLGRLPLKRQGLIHGVFLIAAFVALPVRAARGWTPPESSNPVFWVLLLLFVSVGLPAFVISSTAPLLQRWFSQTGHRDAADPYFLYSASNAGSLASLLAYPLLIEPSLRIGQQSWAWTFGYALLVALIAVSVTLVARAAPAPAPAPAAPPKNKRAKVDQESSPSSATRWRWFLLSFAPSSLLLGVTTHITTDIASIPLLWVVPLALYLLTFIIVFARRRLLPHLAVVAVQPFVVLPLALIFALRVDDVIESFPLHLLAFFLAALVCHGELARLRPAAGHLTRFYLWMSLGGVAGGLFNTLAAPFLFPRVYEYPLALVACCLLRPAPEVTAARPQQRLWDWLLPLGVGTTLFVGARLLGDAPGGASFLSAKSGLFAAAAVLVFFLRRRPIRFGFAVGMLVLAGYLAAAGAGTLLFQTRNFFGVFWVSRDPGGKVHVLNHGRTIHGAQSLEAARRQEPLTYFSRGGPLGQVFATAVGQYARQRVAVIGLGAGSIAAYGRPGQQITYYEIDPQVEQMARNPALFTFLSNSPAAIDVVIGDARLTLARAPDHVFDLIVVDAFSSDAIPVHLITREALALYETKLAPKGLLAFNISNRFLDLEAVLANLARDRGWSCIAKRDRTPGGAEDIQRMDSLWAVMARQQADMGYLPLSGGWHLAFSHNRDRLWTDDFSNIVGALKVAWPWRKRAAEQMSAAPAQRQ